MWMLFWAAASRVWKIIRLRAERPVEGELATTMAALSPPPRTSGSSSMSASTSPERLQPVLGEGRLQVAHGRPFDAEHGVPPAALPLAPCRGRSSQWSPKPAPPMNPTLPSTTISSRWVRLLMRGSVYQRIGW